jgi:predicted acylesterase/phospholipase RssA
VHPDKLPLPPPPVLAAGTKYDLVLSSGFLAFANHCGFLQAVDDVGLPVNGIMGTSAGALIGSLYAAGWSPRDVSHSSSTDSSLLTTVWLQPVTHVYPSAQRCASTRYTHTRRRLLPSLPS